MVESFGYFFALVVGVILGLIGGGGSILAVPIFVYFFLMDEKLAAAYSLFVVGFSALVGSAKQYSKEFIDFRTVLVFGIAGIGVLIGNFMQSLLEGPKLRKGFGYFLLLISFFIVYMEFLRP